MICPKCKTKLPLFRTPTNLNQMLMGGWTCPKCGCEVDRKGNNITIRENKRIYETEIIKERARLQAQKEFRQHKKN